MTSTGRYLRSLREQLRLRRRFLHEQQRDLDRAAAIGDVDRALSELVASSLGGSPADARGSGESTAASSAA